MLLILCLLLFLSTGRCTDDHIFQTKIYGVGQNVTLTCPRQTSSYATFFWTRLLTRNLPEVLGGTYSFSFDYNDVDETPRITTKQEYGSFVLDIKEAELGDTGFYYCFETSNLKLTFLTGTFLRIKGPEPDITVVTKDFPSDPVHPGSSVTLQCSVLTDHTTCLGEHNVFWFKHGLNESNPSFIYTQRNSDGECERNHGSQTCYYTLSDFTSSDAGTYYCAVAACGKIIIGNGTKLDIEVNMWELQKANTVIIVLCAALAISLVVIAFLIYSLKKTSDDCDKASVTQKMNAATSSGDQKSLQTDQDSVIYSTAKFTKRKAYAAAEDETIYTNVRTFQAD